MPRPPAEHILRQNSATSNSALCTECPPLPGTDTVLSYYAAHLSATLQPTSVRTYMSAIRNLHVELGYDYPSGPTTLLCRVMQGISHLPNSERTRLPITMPLLRRLCSQIRTPHLRSPQDKSMLHAALTVGFHGFLRCGELVNLTRDDITLAADLTALGVRIQHSKTDQSGKGFTLLIGPSPDQEICPVRAIQQYLSLKFQSSHAQLFTYRSGAALSKQDISREIRNLLPLCGVVCPEEYATHSLRIGAATTAAIAGVPEHLIRHMGRWKSDAALKYIRVSSVKVSQLSAKLASVE